MVGSDDLRFSMKRYVVIPRNLCKRHLHKLSVSRHCILCKRVLQDRIPLHLCKRHLHKWKITVFVGELPHIFEVADGVAAVFAIVFLQVGRQHIDDFRAPSLFFLFGEDVVANLPIMAERSRIKLHYGVKPLSVNFFNQTLKPYMICFVVNSDKFFGVHIRCRILLNIRDSKGEKNDRICIKIYVFFSCKLCKCRLHNLQIPLARKIY